MRGRGEGGGEEYDASLEKLGSRCLKYKVVHRSKYTKPFSMDYREQGSHSRDKYLTHNTSPMGTVEEIADTEIIVIIIIIIVISLKQSLSNAYA